MRKKLWYCKSRKKEGNPITEINLDTKEEKHLSHIRYTNVNIDMDFNNATGKAKGSGATTILNVDDEGIVPFDDDKSHDLQGRIDMILDYLQGKDITVKTMDIEFQVKNIDETTFDRDGYTITGKHLKELLEGIRDDIPCTCDKEESK